MKLPEFGIASADPTKCLNLASHFQFRSFKVREFGIDSQLCMMCQQSVSKTKTVKLKQLN